MRFSDLKLLLVGGLVGAAIISERLLPLAVLGIVLVWAASALYSRRLGVRTPADWGILALVLILPLNLWASPVPAKSLPQILRLLTGIALFYAVAEAIHDRARVRLAIVGLALAGIGLVALAPFGVEWAKDKLTFIPTSLFEGLKLRLADSIHPNVMAGYLLVLLPPLLAALLFNWDGLQRAERGFFIFSSILMTLVMVLTKTRAAVLGLAVAGVLLAALHWRRAWLVIALLGVLGAAILIAVGPGILFDPFMNPQYGVSTLSGRMDIWSRGLMMVRDFPFTGVGMGLYSNFAGALYPLYAYDITTVPHAHNLFLQIAVDLGIPGLVAWLAVFASLAAQAWSIFRACVRSGQRTGWLPALAAGMLACLIAIFIQGALDAVTWGMVRPAPLVWGVLGLVAAGGNLSE